MQQNELAKLLDISPAMVSRLKKQGMPTDDLERAQRWRKRHLEPGRIKGSRFDPTQTTKPTAPKPAHAAAALPGVSVAEVEAAGVELDKALTEDDKELTAVMVQQVRELLRKISPDAKPRLSLRAWLALLDWLIHPDCDIRQAPDKATLLSPAGFGMIWHGWPNFPTLNENTLEEACDWDDIAVKGWPEYPDDDKFDEAAAEG